MEDERRRTMISVGIVVTIVFAIAICMIIKHNVEEKRAEMAEIANTAKSEQEVERLENKIEMLEDQVEEEHKNALEQHLEVVKLDNKQLELDIVYIDAELNARNLRNLIERKDSSDMPTAPVYRNKSTLFGIGYTNDEYDELVKALTDDSQKKNLALFIVEECLGNRDHNLDIPNAEINAEIKAELNGEG